MTEFTGTEVVDMYSSIVMKYLLVPKSGIFPVIWVLPRVVSKCVSERGGPILKAFCVLSVTILHCHIVS